MSIARIALLAGLLVFGVLAGLFLRADRDRPDAPQTPATQPAPPSAPTSTPEPGPNHRGPAIDESLAGRLGVHAIENTTCPIMGNPTDASSFSILYNGLVVRFCCPGCDTKFLADPHRHLVAMKKVGADVPDSALEPSAHPAVVDLENEACPATGNPIGESKHFVVHQSYRIRVCCPKCIPTIAKTPLVVAELIAQAKASAPAVEAPAKVSAPVDIGNASCPIMGNPTNEDSFSITYNGLRVRFCCPGCDTRFLEKPREHLAAMAREGAKVPATALTEKANPEVLDLQNGTCPVTEEAITEASVYVVARGLKIHLCCEGCVDEFNARPEDFLAALAKTDSRVASRVGE